MRAACLAVVTTLACSRPALHIDAPDPPRDRVRHYTIWLGGARVGTATEHETWSASGVVLRREEAMRFLRGDATVALATTIEVTANHALVPSRVTWAERGQHERHAEAVRDAAGAWVADVAIASNAVPAELVPLLTRRDGRFGGPVFLPARGFIGGTGRIDAVAPDRLVARLTLDGGAIAEATIDIDADREFTRVVDGEGVIAILVDEARAAAPFQPVDLIAATAIPITGFRSDMLVVDGSIALPAVPGQIARRVRGEDGITLELSAQLPGDLPLPPRSRDRSREITALVAQVRARIVPDLSAHPTSPRDASSATAGDCTTFALAYAALAARKAIPTQVVTGLRVDRIENGDRLVRHRWAVSWTGRAWIAVDAAYGAAPAGGDLIGLSVHGADDAGLVSGEAALTQIRSATWR